MKIKNQIKVINEANYLFLTFECPFCEKQNVLNKHYTSTEVICSNSGCRKVILLKLTSSNEHEEGNENSQAA